uniref:hypothetical protein n=1 Tax=Paraburkholderia sp. J63 TaxID=2805434 RepID=UPI002ABD255D
DIGRPVQVEAEIHLDALPSLPRMHGASRSAAGAAMGMARAVRGAFGESAIGKGKTHEDPIR